MKEKEKESLIGKDTNEIIEIVKSFNEKDYRGKQISKWIYQKFTDNFENMSDISKDLRNELSKKYYLYNGQIIKTSNSDDGTIKYLIKFNNDTIEAVNIFQKYHLTACISTQVGCNVKCPFCATGLSGFRKNLSASEIVQQFLLMQRESKERISNIVYMGMGEPLLNYDNTIKSVKILNKEVGIGIRNITISTSGILKGMEKIIKENLQFNLAISLHTADEEQRNKLVPINKNNPLKDLLFLCKKYVQETNRRITFEYVMLNNINDSIDHAKLLIEKLKGIHCHINLIPHNKIYSSENYESTPMNKIKLFKDILSEYFPTTIRVSRGREKDSACGQLRIIQGV
ncbi:MAG: putative dual-specificity RNA methyltransferase RlmN [Candidatus Sericytochromatia bacterium]|nr:MAG: putative dual-specificity RNA methyltransferase RlmN [Candidatus Sericytochromatia bacterium]